MLSTFLVNKNMKMDMDMNKVYVHAVSLCPCAKPKKIA
jgi:hypothetical protein